MATVGAPVVWLSLASCLASAAAGDEPENSGTRFHVKRYTTDDGLPQTRVACLAQTPDGYLWCGTWFGLARFDGVRFVTFDRYNTPAFGANHAVQQLTVDAQGRLWVGTREGLLRQTDRGFVEVPLIGGWGGHGVSGLWAQPGGGGVWAVGENGLVRTDGTNTTSMALPPGPGIPRVMASGKGMPFIIRQLEGGGLTGWQPDNPSNSWRPIAMSAERKGNGGLIGSTSNGVWVYCGEGLFLCGKDGQAHRQSLPAPLAAAGIQNATPARDDGFWLADTAGRLWRWHAGKAEELHVDGAPDFIRGVQAMFEDREANLWVACDEGLVQLRRRVFRCFTTRDGLPADEIWSVCPARKGGVWVGGQQGGVCRIGDQGVEHLPALAQVGIAGLTVHSVLEDSQGRLLANATHGLGVFQFANRAWEPWPDTAPFGDVLYEDRKNRLWVGGSGGAVWRDGAQWRCWSRTNGLPDAGVRVIHQSSDGRIWFGTQRGGLARLDEQTGEVRVFGRTQGLASDEVWAIHETEGALWIGGNRGLARLSLATAAAADKTAAVWSFTPEHGMPDDAVNWILEDDQGYLWLSGLRGIHRIARSELEAVALGESAAASCATFGIADGMENPESNGEHAPAGGVDAEGRLWFPTGKGVVRIDVKLVNVMSEPPPAVVLDEVRVDEEEVLANGFQVAASQVQSEPSPNPSFAASHKPLATRLRLGPGRARLVKFGYTAPMFVNAERARFRHRLRGLSDAWHEAGEERVVYFTNLKPGDYVFEVTAANAHGIWARAPAVFAFSLAPRFTETAWFPSILVGGGLILAGSFVNWRLRWQRRVLKLDEQRAVADERARIARDLHDDLGASLTGVALQLEAAHREGRAEGKQLAELAGETRSLALELRELAWATNPRCDNAVSLAGFIGEFVERFCQAAGLEWKLDLPSGANGQAVPARVRHTLLVVVKEALANVAKHADGSQVAVTLSLSGSQARLVIQDNGRGFDPSRVAGGNGLNNLRERLQQLNGSFTVESRSGGGTTVTASLPLDDVPDF